MQFITATVDEREFIVVVNEYDENEYIQDLVAETYFYEFSEVKLGPRTPTCDKIIRAMGLMQYDILEVKDEHETLGY